MVTEGLTSHHVTSQHRPGRGFRFADLTVCTGTPPPACPTENGHAIALKVCRVTSTSIPLLTQLINNDIQ